METVSNMCYLCSTQLTSSIFDPVETIQVFILHIFIHLGYRKQSHEPNIRSIHPLAPNVFAWLSRREWSKNEDRHK